MKRSSRLPDLSVEARRTSALLIAAVLIVALGGAWMWLSQIGRERTAKRAFTQESGSIALQGIAAPVDILRDARGVPHILAVRERDAWVGLGFIHGQDRLAQLLWMRRLARGRTAEVVGPPGVESDRMARVLGIGRAAEAEAERLDPGVLEVLLAYAEGINARLARVREGRAPPPLTVVGRGEDYTDWTPADSLAVVKLLAWSSSNLLETGIVLDDLIERLGSQLARPFRPTGAGVEGADIPSELSPIEVARKSGAQPPGELLAPSRGLVASTSIQGGSAWVFGGRHTESRAPILVADLHLPPTSPPLVYEIHLRGGEVDIAGATIPGAPVVWAGRNLHVAWSATPARAVTADLYKETLRGRDDSYQNGSKWVPLQQRTELIRVRGPGGALREEEIVVRSTRHGPLINELLFPTGPSRLRAERSRPAGTQPAGDPVEPAAREPLALAWTGTLPGNGVASLLGVARARDSDELISALERHHEPVVAVVYADDRGQAGMQLAGWLPQRVLPTSLVPVPGRLRLFNWREPIDFAALPAIRIDATATPRATGNRRSWLAVADGSLDDGLTAAGIEWLWRTGERQRRLEARLGELTDRDAEPVDLRAAAALQQDQRGQLADEMVPALLRLAQVGGPLRPEAREIAQLLGRWNRGMEVGSRGAVAYQVLMEHLIEELFHAPFGETLFLRYMRLPGARPVSVVASLVLAADRHGDRGGWSDRELLSTAIRSSLRKTWVSLSYRLGPGRDRWEWGRLHRIAFRPFAGIGTAYDRPGRAPGPLLANGTPRGLLAMGGDETTVAASAFSRVGSYQVSSVAGYRFAVDLAAPDRMLSSLAPGQSEHPLHPHATDGTARWLDGRPALLLTSRLLVEEESSGARLLLEPAP